MTTETGKIQTVDGRVDPTKLGFTLPHEHVFFDFVEEKFTEPTAASAPSASASIKLSNVDWIRRHPRQHKDNLKLNDFETAVDELSAFRQHGGNTLVDVTPKDAGATPEDLRTLMRETDVTIVHGTGYYKEETQPDRVADMSATELSSEFVDDIINGIGTSDVKAGLIGEIGITGPDHVKGAMSSRERTILQATAAAAIETGVTVSIHPPSMCPPARTGTERCLDILDFLTNLGLPERQVVFCHRDHAKWNEANLKSHRVLIERGAYVEFDLFGHVPQYVPSADEALADDMDRCQWIQQLVEEDYHHRLLCSQDIYTKTMLQAYGGHGYSHLLKNVVPTMRSMGLSQSALDTIFIENPRRLLAVE